MLKTRMTEILGVKYPIQCGSMHWLSRAELVAAVAEAGGFACLTAATMVTPENLEKEIKKTQALTDKPFGVNISLFPTFSEPDIIGLIDVVIQTKVPIIETAGNPEKYRPQIKEGGLIHVHKVARVKDAMKAERLDVDIVAIVGTEEGGHPGEGGVSSMVNVPKAAESISKPLLAGGGFCDGRSAVAALALGAEGVIMGTRFMTVKECLAHTRVKEYLIQAQETDTVLVMSSLHNPARVLHNRWADTCLEMEFAGKTIDELYDHLKGERTLKGYIEGDPENSQIPLGSVIGRIHDMPTVAELMERIVAEMEETKDQVARFWKN